jgi:hypothetical protein
LIRKVKPELPLAAALIAPLLLVGEADGVMVAVTTIFFPAQGSGLFTAGSFLLQERKKSVVKNNEQTK